MPASALESAKAVSEIADKLFGRLGAALLISAVSFFSIPAAALKHFGLNPADPSQRSIAGFLMLVSAATCLVSLVIKTRSSLSWSLGWFSDRVLYWRLSTEARIILGLMAQTEIDRVHVPKLYEPGQELIDKQLMFASDSSGPTLTLKRYRQGDAFVKTFRKTLRNHVFKNQELAGEIGELLTKAGKEPRAGWMAY